MSWQMLASLHHFKWQMKEITVGKAVSRTLLSMHLFTHKPLFHRKPGLNSSVRKLRYDECIGKQGLKRSIAEKLLEMLPSNPWAFHKTNAWIIILKSHHQAGHGQIPVNKEENDPWQHQQIKPPCFPYAHAQRLFPMNGHCLLRHDPALLSINGLS